MAQLSHKTGRPKKKITGVGLDPDVWDYLQQLAHALNQSVSWVINEMVREEMRRNQEAQDA